LSRIKNIFENRTQQNKKVNIAYVTPGYPFEDITVDLALLLAGNNVQIVEIGVPFSDPLADGPTIQNSSYNALLNGINLTKILKTVEEIRQQSEVGIVLMSYLNPILAFGPDIFLKKAQQAGVDGIIIPDMPVDEIDFIKDKVSANNLDLILLAAPTSTRERLEKIASNSSGFIYCVSVTGVTGIRKSDYIEKDTITFLDTIRSISKIPTALGFGISEKGQIQKLWAHTDGFIIGSALIKTLEKAADKSQALENAQKFIRAVFIN
jgi:tryptophan synthase alpha chain